MHIRRANISDIDEIGTLYKDTITTINSKDYTKEQIVAWTATYNNEAGWIRRIEEQHFYVATIDDIIVGFASIDNNGYFDLLYVHKDFQKQGVATNLCSTIENKAKEMGFDEITVQSSITAKPFFTSQGFIQTSEKKKEINGVPFTNAVMSKKI